MRIVALGDVHSRWHKVGKIFRHEIYPDMSTGAVSVGDLCSYRYPFPVSLPFSPGNHDRPLGIANLADHAYLIPLTADRGPMIHEGIRILGIGGLEQPRGRNEGQPKFFSEADIRRLEPFARSVDLLVTHEAPHNEGLAKAGQDIGSSLIREAIETVQPRFAIFGHHHISADFFIGKTRVLGLPYPHHGYSVIDFSTDAVEHVQATLVQRGNRRVYEFAWEPGSLESVNFSAAQHLLEQGNLSQAEQEFRRNPVQHPQWHYGLATTLFQLLQQGAVVDLTETDIQYRAALLLDPENADAHLLYGKFLEAQATMIPEPSSFLRRAAYHQQLAARSQPSYDRYVSASRSSR